MFSRPNTTFLIKFRTLNLLVRIGEETEEMREHSGVENGLNSGFKPAGETTERRCRLYEDAVVVVVVAFCIGESGDNVGNSSEFGGVGAGPA